LISCSDPNIRISERSDRNKRGRGVRTRFAVSLLRPLAMFMFCKAYTICFLFFFIPVIALADNDNFTHLTVKDGLLNSTVYYAMQDSKGFIWFCTETGVNRYNGSTFESFTINNGLGDNEIFKCFEDSKGRIWFLSYNGQLSYYYKGIIYNHKNAPWLFYRSSGAFLLDILEDKNGIIWITTSSDDVLKIVNNTIEIITPPFTTKQQHNKFYLAANLFVENDSVKKFVETYSAAHDSIYLFNLINKDLSFIGVGRKTLFQQQSIHFYDRHSQIFLVDKTLIKYNTKGFAMFDAAQFGITSRLMCFLTDGNNFWLGTAGDGVLKTDTTFSNKKILHLLPGKTITSMLKDNENNLWFATHGDGVFLLRNNGDYITTLPTKTTYSIGIVTNKTHRNVIAGNDNSDIYFLNDTGITSAFPVSKTKFNRIRDIIPIADTAIYIGADDQLLYRYNIKTKTIARLGPQQGYKNYSIAADNTLWICSNACIYKISGNNITSEYRIKNMGKCTTIAFSSDTTCYMGTTNSLYKISNINKSQYQTILYDSVLITSISDLKIIEHTLWVATHGNGIFILKDDTVYKHITSQNDNITSNVCQKLYDDRERFVWLCTNNGISVINRDNYNCYRNLTTNIGLTSTDIKGIAANGDYMYIATAEGTNIFKFSTSLGNSKPPNIYFTNFRKENTEIIDPGDTVTFNYFKGFIDIFFTAISFQSPSDIQYEYKFENDEKWHNTKSTNISLSNLQPGNYKLLCRARKYNSAWSSPALLNIIINPLWYQTNWFYGAVILLIILAIYLIIYLRTKAIHRQVAAQTLLQNKIRDLENKSLAYQMNPHFIFNSLNTIQQFMLVEKQEQGLNYLNDFSVLMRKMLENSRKPYITLNEEIDFLTRYLQLEQIRFNNKFEYSIDIEKELLADDIKIPPVLFQPLLENAIKHGIATNSKGVVSLKIEKEGDCLKGIVEDNGIGIFSSTSNTGDIQKESTALKVLEERLKLISTNKGKTGSIQLIDKSHLNPSVQGTIIEIITPILE